MLTRRHLVAGMLTIAAAPLLAETVRALPLTIPASLLAGADHVVE